MLTMLARWQILRIDQSDIVTIRRFAPMSHTHNTTHLTALYPGLPGWAGTRKVTPIWILLKQETVSGSGISWAICKSAPRSSQITTPAPHRSVFTGRMPFLPPNQQCQSTEGSVSAAKNFRPILHIGKSTSIPSYVSFHKPTKDDICIFNASAVSSLSQRLSTVRS